MSTPPLAQMMARQLISRMAGAQGGPQGPPSGPPQGGPAPSPAGVQLSQQLSELQGADPDAMLKAITQVKGIIISLYPQAAMKVPGVARNLAQAVKYLDNAIADAEKAAATIQSVTPIANNASIANPTDQGINLGNFASGGGA